MLESQSVKELQNIIKSRQISIKEVVEYYLDRIEKLNPDLNAIVLQKDRELIIKEAIEKDKAKEIDKSLNGLPIAIKDLTDVVGFKTTYGFPGSKNNQPKKNSLFVNRLINKGAIIMGKQIQQSLALEAIQLIDFLDQLQMFTIYQNLLPDRVGELAQLLLLDYYHLQMVQIRWDRVEDLQHTQIFMVLDLHQV